jgi:hypothetical protein
MSRMKYFRLAVNLLAGVGLWLGAGAIGLAQDVDVSQVGWWRQRPCPRGTVPVYPSEAAPTEVQPAPGQAQLPQAMPAETIPPGAMNAPDNAFAGGFGAAAGPMGVPNMIGDLPGINPRVTFSGSSGSFESSLPLAAGGGLFKIADNSNPIPTDRVFFDYNHFQNALDFVGTGGTQAFNLNAYTFGVEKTFFNGMCSLEVRVPFASGLSAVQNPTDTGIEGTEFGNIPIVFKTLIHRGENSFLSAGLAGVIASARDVNLGDGSLIIRNESFHLQPFVGWLWQPRERLFFEAFAACDFDAGGSPVIANGPRIGTYQQQSLLFLDGKIGYWAYQNPCARWVTGIAPTVELHYTSTMQDAPVVSRNGFGITPIAARQDILDLTGGLQFQLGPCTDLTLAGCAPLRTGNNKLFDAEFMVQLNRRF